MYLTLKQLLHSSIAKFQHIQAKKETISLSKHFVVILNF